MKSGGLRNRDAVELAETPRELVPERRGDTDRTDTLHVAVTANREQARPLAADHSPCQCQVDDGLDVVDAVQVVGDPHGPGPDGLAGSGDQLGSLAHLLGRYATSREQIVAVRGAQVREYDVPTFDMRRQEGRVRRPAFEDLQEKQLQERDVGSDVRLEI